MTNAELAARFFLLLAAVLVCCKCFGYLFRKLGQPTVIGEMVAGIFLGPTLLGRMFPELQEFLFPKQAMPVLFVLSQVALALYMFLVGLEINPSEIKGRLRSAAAVSVAGIAAPLLFGAMLAASLKHRLPLFGEQVSTQQAMLFMGAAMSITAFPVLARIVTERGLAKSPLGTLVLTAASLDDAFSWCLLAVVLASTHSDPRIAAVALGGGVLYVLCVVMLVRPFLKKFMASASRRKETETFSLILLLILISACVTDMIGIHAIFGSFILGAVMPRGQETDKMIARIEPLTTQLFLPLFFIYSGLNTNFKLVDSPDLWILASLVFAVATAGKLVACGAGAWLTGETLRTSLAIGSLMNARGLVELIMLNIGLQTGIITPVLFTVMVMMALATTFLATPLFELFRESTKKQNILKEGSSLVSR
jgi:Kef-type K+ transport system membrane component KefB